VLYSDFLFLRRLYVFSRVYFRFNAAVLCFKLVYALADLPEDPNAAKTRLSLAQIKCEKMYIEAEGE